ncbi:MAG TPA: Gfo/Idh/MocA family oxidoreductase, partial [Terracidiphilus sp.]|nr:Gfo/Idh/MocA family oxidoreductase [Terracidiphilus sp.]
DQALTLFGKPEAVAAEVLCERDWARACDSITLRLRYPDFSVVLGANYLMMPSRPRFHLRGTNGNYWKSGLDPQEAALNKVTHIDDPDWGKEPAAEWGMLYVDVNGSTVTRSIEPIPGDYRLYYAGVRDALLGNSPAPVAALAAWRVARLMEWALESSKQRSEIICDWSEEPK